MKRKGQLEFQGHGFTKPGDEFGGSLLKGNAKGKRPLATRLPIHLTLRAEKSVLRLPKTFKPVNEIIAATAKKYGVTIYKQANVGNHLHLLIRIPKTGFWAPFIRELTGRIAQEVLGRVMGLATRFRKFKPHTRIVRGWRKAFRSALDYVELNRLEAEGLISRAEIKSLRELRRLWADDWVGAG